MKTSFLFAVPLSVLGLALSPLTAWAEPGTAGRIIDAVSRAPIAGARVFVYTAAPKVRTSPVCPSCYPDCGKKVQADETGRFRLVGLSSQLRFRLLVVANGYTPQFLPRVESDMDDIEVKLQARAAPDVPPEQRVHGRIIDAEGKAVPGAVMEVFGTSSGNTQSFGAVQKTDPIVVTDERGEYVLASSVPLVGLYVHVTAQGMANQTRLLLAGMPQTIKLTEGAILTGRVLLDGKPLANVAVGVSGMDRAAGTSVGRFEIGTDADGRFRLTNLPPKTDFFFYGVGQTLAAHGLIPQRPVHVTGDGEVTDLGDVLVRPGLQMSGRVSLADKTSLPESTKIMLSHEETGDSQTAEVLPDGRFEFRGVPSGVV